MSDEVLPDPLPRVGDVVHYVNPRGLAHQAAIVTAIQGPATLTLNVFPPGASSFSVDGVRWSGADPAPSGTWHYPEAE